MEPSGTVSWRQLQCMLNVREHKLNFKPLITGLNQLNINTASSLCLQRLLNTELTDVETEYISWVGLTILISKDTDNRNTKIYDCH
jgi:hypothetical protein